MIATGLRAGVGRATITPPVGIAHGGWGAQTHERAAGVDLDMWVTVLMLCTDQTEALVVDLDLGVLGSDDAAALRGDLASAIGIPSESIRVSYTHTHAGPVTSQHNRFVTAGQDLVGPYLQSLRAQTVGAARQARQALRECRVAAGWGSSGIAVNRRFRTPEGRVVIGPNPSGPTDDHVLVVRLEDLDEQPVACLVGYACHPIALAYQNDLLSPDFPGVTRRVVEDLTGATCLYLQGSAGDLMPIEALTGDTGVHRRLGKQLGAEAAKVFLGLHGRRVERHYDHILESGAPLGIWTEDPQPDEPVELQCSTRTLSLPVRSTAPVEGVEAELADLYARLERLRNQPQQTETAKALNFQAKRLGMLAQWSRWCAGRSEVDVELHALRIGPVGLVGFPGEPFSETGVAVRNKSPLPFTQLGGYTNGWRGYVPTSDAFDSGGYEVETGSTFSSGAAARLEDEALDILTEMCGR